MKINDRVEIIGGNNEIGQPTMIGRVGIILGFGTKYKVKGVDAQEVFVDFVDFVDYGTHCFNDYHLRVLL